MSSLARSIDIPTIIIFGNSGSGKSTLAKHLSAQNDLAHLDLDTLAWLPSEPPQRAPLADSQRKIMEFVEAHDGWVIEGCYTDLLELVAQHASEIIYLDLPVSACIENAKRRPWEPHKYPSKQAQDANLAMLLEWIAQYTQREDTFSAHAHQAFYAAFEGHKKRLQHNQSLS